MDLNDLRVGFTLLSFALFVGLFLHTWSRRRSAEHEQAERLPFAGEGLEQGDGRE